jgi:hypothetical protein
MIASKKRKTKSVLSPGIMVAAAIAGMIVFSTIALFSP